MDPVPDGDRTPVRVPVLPRRRARHLASSSPSPSACQQPRHPLRRPRRPRPRRALSRRLTARPRVTGVAELVASGSAGAGRSRSTRSSSSRSTTPTHGFYAAGGPGRPPRRLPHQPRGRAALRRRRRPGARRAGGTSSASPTRSSSSRPAPGRARSPASSSPPRRACAPALRYVLVERSAALRAPHAEHLALDAAGVRLREPADPDDEDEPPAGRRPARSS